MMEQTKEEPIDFATVTDLNGKEEFKTFNFKALPIEGYLSLGAPFYSDYHKPDKISYIIASKQPVVKAQYYEPKTNYMQERPPVCIYSINEETDKDELSLMINEIVYTSICSPDMGEKELARVKRNYERIHPEKYQCIIGNKDWFIGIDSSMAVESYVLPYDKRAQQEYGEALSHLSKDLQKKGREL